VYIFTEEDNTKQRSGHTLAIKLVQVAKTLIACWNYCRDY
jgi:hypothetical protein